MKFRRDYPVWRRGNLATIFPYFYVVYRWPGYPIKGKPAGCLQFCFWLPTSAANKMKDKVEGNLPSPCLSFCFRLRMGAKNKIDLSFAKRGQMWFFLPTSNLSKKLYHPRLRVSSQPVASLEIRKPELVAFSAWNGEKQVGGLSFRAERRKLTQ